MSISNISTTRPIASGVATVPHVVAFVDGTDDALSAAPLEVVLVQLPDFCDPQALPLLAQQFVYVLGYKGYGLCLTDQQRRVVIKAGPANHRIWGTPASIENAIRAVGFPDAIVTEQTGIRHNGMYRHNGQKRHGGTKWYNIDVEVFYYTMPDDAMISMLTKMINKYKSTRSVLFNLKLTQTTMKFPLTFPIRLAAPNDKFPLKFPFVLSAPNDRFPMTFPMKLVVRRVTVFL